MNETVPFYVTTFIAGFGLATAIWVLYDIISPVRWKIKKWLRIFKFKK